MLNINPGHNQRLMESCKTLRDYSQYVAKVREYAETMSLEEAVELAITECISLIRKKLLKGKSLAVIADELEENVEVIQSLIEEIRKE